MFWDGGIRVPLIVRGPGVKVSAVCEVPVTGAGLYPTILSCLRIGTPLLKGIEGGNLTNLFRAGQATVVRANNELARHFPRYQSEKGTTPQSAIRAGEWKLIRYYETGESKFFNLARDLGEANGLFQGCPDRVKDPESRLDAYLKSTNAPMARPSLPPPPPRHLALIQHPPPPSCSGLAVCGRSRPTTQTQLVRPLAQPIFNNLRALLEYSRAIDGLFPQPACLKLYAFSAAI